MLNMQWIEMNNLNEDEVHNPLKRGQVLFNEKKTPLE